MQMTQVPPQSDAEIRHICDEWVRNFAPTVAPRLILNAANFEKISKRCFEKGHVSITYLTESYSELAVAGALELTPEPRTLTAQEKFDIEAKKAQDRMDRDYLESIKQQPVFDPKKAEKIAENEKWVKGQTTARNQLGSIIMDYQCNRYTGPGIDILKSEMVQAVLREIKVPAPPGKEIDDRKMDYIQTINFVRATILELPDYPGDRNDVVAALQRVREKFMAEQEKRNKPNRNNGW